MRLGSIAGILAVLALAGCASTAMKAEYDASLVPGGNWRVDCTKDHAKAQTTCFAGTFGQTDTTLKFFQIAYVNGNGPALFVPNDFPGRTPTVRIDSGKVLSDPAAIVTAMKAGQTAYVVFSTWPDGEHRMTVDIAGFAAAYDRLLERVRTAGPA